MDRPAAQAQFLPGSDPSGKDLRQLHGAQLRQGIVGVNDHRDAIKADDLFGGGAVQVAQSLKFGQFTDFDRS
ncbi:hypothetical protein D3C77_684300 [compost metagenome]